MWTKEIDRTKFPRDGMVVSSWCPESRVWFCALFPNANNGPNDDPIAVGEGADPLGATLTMCIALGAVADTGEWKS